MPRLRDITVGTQDVLELRDLKWLAEGANQRGLIRNGIYLLSGPPGAGKTTLALQIATDLASRGQNILYLALEQSLTDIKRLIDNQVFPSLQAHSLSGKSQSPLRDLQKGMAEVKKFVDASYSFDQYCNRVLDNIAVDDSISSMETLPDFYARQISRGPHMDVSLVVIDSIQGQGSTSTSRRPYESLYEFCRWAKQANIAVMLIGHVTKAGSIAGPKTLEHNVDCVIYLRKAMRLRPLFVPKNRFGPERHEPQILETDKFGCLQPAPHAKAKAQLAYGFAPSVDSGFVDVQAVVKLPKYGDRPRIKAPYLPRQELSQLVEIVGSLNEIDISEMTFDINCALPGRRHFYPFLHLPLSISILSSYLQQTITSGSLFVGELDLFRNVRPLEREMVSRLSTSLADEADLPVPRFRHLYLAQESASELVSNGVPIPPGMTIHPVMNLDEVVKLLWPSITEAA